MGIREWLTGGPAKAVTDLATAGADLVERWKPGETKRHQMDVEQEQQSQDSTASARAHDAPVDQITWFDSVVNGINRLIRPVVTIYFLAALAGEVEVKTDHLDPLVLQWICGIIGFWFGGRALLKDLPAAIKYLRSR